MNTELHIEKVPIDQLRPAEYNPRIWSDKARRDLESSLGEFGFVQPIVVNAHPERKGIVVGGNFKLDIARKRGMTEVPVVWVNLDLEKERELNLRLNKNQGEFDYKILADFDAQMLGLVGFESKELDRIFKKEHDEDDFDADAAAASIEPTSKIGDIYQLGPHRLMCGDATNIEHVKALMNGNKADMVFTDPPYNVNYAGRGENTSNHIKNDHMSEQDFRALLENTFKNYAAVLKADGAIYVCYASRTHREFEDSLNKAGFYVKQQIIWVKKVASMGWGHYRWKHEPILYATHKDSKVNFYGDRSQYTEWNDEPTDEEIVKMVRKQIEKDESGASTVWRMHRESKYDHPTQKPVKLVQIPITNSSKRGDIVLDLFGGSFSTMLAAHKINRACYSMELDTRYVDVGIRRMLNTDPDLTLMKNGSEIDKEPWL